MRDRFKYVLHVKGFFIHCQEILQEKPHFFLKKAEDYAIHVTNCIQARQFIK